MKSLTILVPDGQINLSSIIGSYKIFTRANEYWKRTTGKEDIFNIRLAGISKQVELYDGLFSVRPHVSISTIKKTDLIVIPSLNYNYPSVLKNNKSMTDWITLQHKNGAEIASICTGAFLLASTKLVDGKKCSTHWAVGNDFKTMFPEVELVSEKIITDEHGIYTNGGAYSFLSLVLYLVEKYYDRQTAIYCSKVFQIDIDRDSQSPFTIFKGQKSHNDELIKKAQELIEQKPEEKISFEKLASKLAVSRRNFDRRFVKVTGNTPVEYQQRVRVESAKKLFETSGKNISEVMFEVGYSDMKAFRDIFRRITGLSPLEYRKKYNKDRQLQ